VRISGTKLERLAIVGYARVSTDSQSLAAQVAELEAAGALTVHDEKVSGAVADRASLKKATNAALSPSRFSLSWYTGFERSNHEVDE
jgi:predicted site-specific integrase-resolvase